MDLGKAIKALRERKNVRQQTLASQCQISQTYLSQIENNQKEPNLSILKIIAENLKVPLPIIFFLSLDKADIKPDKLTAFEMLEPSIKSLISEFFTKE